MVPDIRIIQVILSHLFGINKFKPRFELHLYIHLSFCLCPIKVKTAEPIGSKFCVLPRFTPVNFMNDQNFKSLCLKVFLILQNFENERTNILKSANFYFYTVQKEDAHR